MGLFQKLPVDIEAWQFETNNENGSPHMDGLVHWINVNGGQAFHDKTSIYVHTLEGQHRANVGDWIIRGVKGEFYPCKPDIFAETYTAVTASTPGTRKSDDSDPAVAENPSTYTFGSAIEALKAGDTVARAGWNGKGMYLFLVSGGDMDHPALPFGAQQQEYIAMRTVTGSVVPWLASQTDVLADDWQDVEVAR